MPPTPPPRSALTLCWHCGRARDEQGHGVRCGMGLLCTPPPGLHSRGWPGGRPWPEQKGGAIGGPIWDVVWEELRGLHSAQQVPPAALLPDYCAPNKLGYFASRIKLLVWPSRPSVVWPLPILLMSSLPPRLPPQGTPAAPASSLFLRHIRVLFTSGPLHVPLPLS